MKQTFLPLILFILSFVPCLAQNNTNKSENEPVRYSYNISGIVLNENSQPMPKTTVCFVPSERPVNGRIPCTKTDSNGNFNFTVKEVSDKYSVCASTGATTLLLAGDNHRVTCTESSSFGAEDESRKIELKFKVGKS